MRLVTLAGLGAALLLLGGSALAAPERPGDARQRVTPDPEITPVKDAPVGAKARERNGPEALARPSEEVGMTPDPDEVPGGQGGRAPR